MSPTKLERSTFASGAYAAIREILLEGTRYAAGEKISVEALSRELGISRSPVWAAVSRLESEGLLEVVPRRGVFVVAFDEPKIVSVFETREALEGMAARLAARRLTSTDENAMREALARQEKSIKERDSSAYSVANLEFHHALLRAAKNPTIENSLKALYAQTQTMCLGTDNLQFESEQLQQNLRSHQHVFKMLTQRNEDEAERGAREHVRQLLSAILSCEKRENPANGADRIQVSRGARTERNRN